MVIEWWGGENTLWECSCWGLGLDITCCLCGLCITKTSFIFAQVKNELSYLNRKNMVLLSFCWTIQFYNYHILPKNLNLLWITISICINSNILNPFVFSLHWTSRNRATNQCSQLIDRNMSVSTPQHWTNTKKTLWAAKTLSPLISESTSETRKQPDNPQPKAKGKQESTPSTAESKQGRGEIYTSQSRARHSGLGKGKHQH